MSCLTLFKAIVLKAGPGRSVGSRQRHYISPTIQGCSPCPCCLYQRERQGYFHHAWWWGQEEEIPPLLFQSWEKAGEWLFLCSPLYCKHLVSIDDRKVFPSFAFPGKCAKDRPNSPNMYKFINVKCA